jgi:uncharacterized protein (TIGR02147 family)
MVHLSRARAEKEKLYYIERLRELSPAPQASFKQLEDFRFMQNPLHCFIAELAVQKDFNPSPEWIKKRLRSKATLKEIDEAIDRLVSLQILKQDQKGNLKRIDLYINTPSDFANTALKTYHKNLMELATQAVEEQPTLEREFQGMTLNADPKKMPAMKEKIRKFISEFTSEFNVTQTDGEEVLQLNLQLFKVSHPLKQEKEST